MIEHVASRPVPSKFYDLLMRSGKVIVEPFPDFLKSLRWSSMRTYVYHILMLAYLLGLLLVKCRVFGTERVHLPHNFLTNPLLRLGVSIFNLS
jgi:hypothetical protein